MRSVSMVLARISTNSYFTGNKMTCIPIPYGTMCGNFAPDLKILDVTGKQFTFEDNPQFGPIVTTQNGAVSKNQPNEKHFFWAIYQLWSDQGKKIGEDGFCIWAAPPKERLVWIGGRNYAEEGSALALKFGKEK